MSQQNMVISLRSGLLKRLECVIVLLLMLLPGLGFAGEIRTLEGKSYHGEVVGLTPTEVRLQSTEEQRVVAYALKDIISINWGTPLRPATRVPYLRLRLNDGTQVYCLTLELRGKTVKSLLISGQTLEANLDHVHHILCDAHESASLAAFDAMLAERPKQDVIRVQSREGNTVEPYEGLIQSANEQGTRLLFKARGLDNTSSIDVARLRGLYFHRTQTGAGPQAVARIYDTFGNCFTVQSFLWSEKQCDLTLQSGNKLSLERNSILRFDLTPGKMVYLSDVEPSKVEETPILAELFHYRRDKNLEGGPLSVGRKVYAKGLALHSRTVLEYDIEGYTTFRCILGLDDAMTGTAHASVRLEGDERELLAVTLSSRDSKPQDLAVSVKGIKKLRVIVDYGEDLDLGDHVNLADARLIK